MAIRRNINTNNKIKLGVLDCRLRTVTILFKGQCTHFYKISVIIQNLQFTKFESIGI